MLLPSLTAGIVYFLCVVPARQPDAAASAAVGHVALVQKDGSWRPLPSRPDGPRGDVSYSAHGTPFRFTLHASGLRPGTRYLIELNVDGATDDVASRVAGPTGEMTLDTALSAFAAGRCRDTRLDARSAHGALRGTHQIKFLLKRNGRPAADGPAAAVSQAKDLSCAGNGDGDFSYILFEEKLANYDGSE